MSPTDPVRIPQVAAGAGNNAHGNALFILVSLAVTLIGCSINVPLKRVYGTYKAAYPFGTETITLNEDGTFVQEVAMKDQAPVSLRSRWEFDSKDSRVNFDRLMMVVDGHGHLKSHWQTATPGIASLDVETRWFRVTMASAATYPYVKQ
jgi:hypothetical protein